MQKKDWKIWLFLICIAFGTLQFPSLATAQNLIIKTTKGIDYSTYPPTNLFTSKEELFDSIGACAPNCSDDIWWGIILTMQKNYELPSVTDYISRTDVKPESGSNRWKNLCLNQSYWLLPSFFEVINRTLPLDESNDVAVKKIQAEGLKLGKQCTDDFGKKFSKSIDKFLNDYIDSYPERTKFKQASEAKAKEEEKRRTEIGKQKYQQYLACLESSPYKLYKAAAGLTDAQFQLKNGQEILSNERKVEAVSGVSNLANKRGAGALIVGAQDYIAKWFPIYKQLGGSASSPNQVVRLPDPCKQN